MDFKQAFKRQDNNCIMDSKPCKNGLDKLQIQKRTKDVLEKAGKLKEFTKGLQELL